MLAVIEVIIQFLFILRYGKTTIDRFYKKYPFGEVAKWRSGGEITNLTNLKRI